MKRVNFGDIDQKYNTTDAETRMYEVYILQPPIQTLDTCFCSHKTFEKIDPSRAIKPNVKLKKKKSRFNLN